MSKSDFDTAITRDVHTLRIAAAARALAFFLLWISPGSHAEPQPEANAGKKSPDLFEKAKETDEKGIETTRKTDAIRKSGIVIDLTERRKMPKHNILVETKGKWSPRDRPFLSALLQHGHNETLLRDLGYFEPDAEAYPFECKDLYSQFLFREGGVYRRLIVFSPTTRGWPGSQPVTFVLTDLDYDVIAWRSAGGEPMIKEIKLCEDGDNHRLDVSWYNRHGNPRVLNARFFVTDNGIFNYDDPSFDQPHFGNQ